MEIGLVNLLAVLVLVTAVGRDRELSRRAVYFRVTGQIPGEDRLVHAAILPSDSDAVAEFLVAAAAIALMASTAKYP